MWHLIRFMPNTLQSGNNIKNIKIQHGDWLNGFAREIYCMTYFQWHYDLKN